MRSRIAAVVLVAVTLLAPGYAVAASVVEATGEAELNLPPDEALLSVGVTTQAATAKDATDENAKGMSAVLAALARAGFAPPDVSTRAVSLGPVMEYPPNAPPKLAGYRATNTAQVKSRDPASIGRALDAAVGAGANVSTGLAFALADPRAAELRALRLAVQDAQRRATAMAEALGKRLGRVVEVRSVETERPPVPRFDTMAVRTAPAATPIEPGLIAVRARAVIKVELR